jgi:putative hydrolase of the HAD superfamily
MVLSNPPDPEAQQAMQRITGLSQAELESYYWVDRHAYDLGDMGGQLYWERLVRAANLPLSPEQTAELNRWDARMWTSANPKMLAWQSALRQKGLQTAILSNMGDTVHERILEAFAWIEEFDVLIWSYEHRLAKPDRAIYELLLEKLGTAPEETLFLDDKLENIEAAHKLGIEGLQFSTVEQLRQDLITTGLDELLPLP